jgi:hypothetical protein
MLAVTGASALSSQHVGPQQVDLGEAFVMVLFSVKD